MRGARRGDHRELLATVTADEAEPEIALAEAIAGGTAPRIVSSQGRARPSSATDFGRVSNRAYKRQGQTMTTASEIFDDANLAEDFPQDLLLLRQEMKERTGAGGRPARPVEAGAAWSSSDLALQDCLDRCAAPENADLFRAIRGGGGNFGVATSFEYRLHPVGPEVFVCFVFYPADRAMEVLQSCERYLGGSSETPKAASHAGS